MNINNICLKCMNEKPSQDGFCPHCGFDESKSPQESSQLDYWTILRGQYLVGKCLGQGGFGITYVGFDMNLELKVAIKEYFPFRYAVRDQAGGTRVHLLEGAQKPIFEEEKRRFIEEARILARFNELPGIVKVRDYFEENDTCYIVMEYVEGDTLQQYVKSQGGVLPAEKVLTMMEPVIKSMIQIHQRGVIHKDISPDNIMITNNGRMKLIDFGSAERKDMSRDTGLQTYKDRYSPLEQRMEEGKVGTYSDIYAFCATMYYCMTGTPPDSVTERMSVDRLALPSSLGAEISPVQEAALLKGLTVELQERIQDAKDLYFFLYMYGQKEGKPDQLRQEIAQKKTKDLMEKIRANAKKQKQKKIYIICAVITLSLLAGHFILQSVSRNRYNQTTSGNAQTGVVENINLSSAHRTFYKAAQEARAKWELDEMTVDEDLEDMAEVFGEVLQNASWKDTAQGWGDVYARGLSAVEERFDMAGVAWMVIPVTEETEAGTVLQRGLSDENNDASFRQCQRLGVEVTVNSQGYIFYVVFMGV